MFWHLYLTGIKCYTFAQHISLCSNTSIIAWKAPEFVGTKDYDLVWTQHYEYRYYKWSMAVVASHCEDEQQGLGKLSVRWEKKKNKHVLVCIKT